MPVDLVGAVPPKSGQLIDRGDVSESSGAGVVDRPGAFILAAGVIKEGGRVDNPSDEAPERLADRPQPDRLPNYPPVDRAP